MNRNEDPIDNLRRDLNHQHRVSVFAWWLARIAFGLLMFCAGWVAGRM